MLTFLTGGLIAFAHGPLLVPGDAAATAANIAAHETLFRLGIAGYLLNVACYIAVTLYFYQLFKPVDRSLSSLAAFFSLIGCAVQASAGVFQVAALLVAQAPAYLSAFSADQLHALGFLSLKLHAQSFNMGLVFFGVYCVLIGLLIVRSTFLPRLIGGLMVLGGLSWLTFLAPPVAEHLRPFNLAVGVLGEGSLTLWLLVRGVDMSRWRDLCGARGLT